MANGKVFITIGKVFGIFFEKPITESERNFLNAAHYYCERDFAKKYPRPNNEEKKKDRVIELCQLVYAKTRMSLEVLKHMLNEQEAFIVTECSVSEFTEKVQLYRENADYLLAKHLLKTTTEQVSGDVGMVTGMTVGQIYAPKLYRNAIRLEITSCWLAIVEIADVRYLLPMVRDNAWRVDFSQLVSLSEGCRIGPQTLRFNLPLAYFRQQIRHLPYPKTDADKEELDLFMMKLGANYQHERATPFSIGTDVDGWLIFFRAEHYSRLEKKPDELCDGFLTNNMKRQKPTDMIRSHVGQIAACTTVVYPEKPGQPPMALCDFLGDWQVLEEEESQDTDTRTPKQRNSLVMTLKDGIRIVRMPQGDYYQARGPKK